MNLEVSDTYCMLIIIIFLLHKHNNVLYIESSNTEEGDNDELSNNCEKYLIFTTGSKTYTPHQVGFKRIKNFKFPTRLDPGPSLRERIAQRERERERQNSYAFFTNWLDYESVADQFDKVDHLIDLHGHIIGMGLSPDHRLVIYSINFYFSL